MSITHENCSGESRIFCDFLLQAIQKSRPDAFRVATSTCAFAVPGKNRFAHLYHKRHTLLATVYLRGSEPEVLPILTDGSSFQLRDRMGSKWADEFPTLIHLSIQARADELADILLNFSLPLAAKKKRSRTLDNRLNDIVLSEGKAHAVLSTRYERSSVLRAQCLERYGYQCQGCGLLMGERYGPIAEKLIHVHHVERLADGGERLIDPTTDLVPLCPNCHSVVHVENPPISLDRLRAMIRK